MSVLAKKNSGFSFGINPINLLLLLAVLISRKNEVRNLKEQWFAVDFEEIEKSRLNKIAIFKREFENYATERLVNKLAHENLVEEAKIAIQRILAERDMTMTNNPF